MKMPAHTKGNTEQTNKQTTHSLVGSNTNMYYHNANMYDHNANMCNHNANMYDHNVKMREHDMKDAERNRKLEVDVTLQTASGPSNQSAAQADLFVLNL